MPWTAAGVVLGYFVMGTISDRTPADHNRRDHRLAVRVGVLAKVPGQPIAGNGETWHWSLAAGGRRRRRLHHLGRQRRGPADVESYLVAMRLPKMQFVGTASVFFMVLNLFKAPCMVKLGLITPQSFESNLALAPAVFLGALAGRWLLIASISGCSRISCWA